jgi:hypothetical protein
VVGFIRALVAGFIQGRVEVFTLAQAAVCIPGRAAAFTQGRAAGFTQAQVVASIPDHRVMTTALTRAHGVRVSRVPLLMIGFDKTAQTAVRETEDV